MEEKSEKDVEFSEKENSPKQQEAVWPIKTDGIIAYTISEHIDGRITINFEQSLENNMVVLMVANYLAAHIVEELKEQKDTLKDTKAKTSMKNMVTKGEAAKFGLNMISEYMQSLFRNHQRNLREQVSKMINKAKS